MVYAKEDGVIIWSSVRANHKQGRVAAGCPLVVIDSPAGWHEIEEPELDREVKPEYPNFYVSKEDVVDEWESPVEPPEEPSEDVDDTMAAIAILTLIKYFKQ